MHYAIVTWVASSGFVVMPGKLAGSPDEAGGGDTYLLLSTDSLLTDDEVDFLFGETDSWELEDGRVEELPCDSVVSMLLV